MLRNVLGIVVHRLNADTIEQQLEYSIAERVMLSDVLPIGIGTILPHVALNGCNNCSDHPSINDRVEGVIAEYGACYRAAQVCRQVVRPTPHLAGTFTCSATEVRIHVCVVELKRLAREGLAPWR